MLETVLAEFGRCDELDAAHSREFWKQIREVEAFHADKRPLWRVSVPPAAGWRVGEVADQALYDWGGGLVWALSEDPGAVRAAARAAGGHAVLYRGPSRLPPFQPLEGPLAALTRRVKAAFDPMGVLNPGRLGDLG
jgi:glycolate oxidase FAD binding subunit